MSRATSSLPRTIGAHAALLAYTAIALFPVVVIIINSFKARNAIFHRNALCPDIGQLLPRLSDFCGQAQVVAIPLLTRPGVKAQIGNHNHQTA